MISTRGWTMQKSCLWRQIPVKPAVTKRIKLAQDLLWMCFFGQSVNLICELYLLARDLLLLLGKGWF